MRIGVIRADLSKAIFVADLESKSQANPAVETPNGQTRYMSRPDAAAVQAYLDGESLAASASALITATVPVGGPVNVASGTITGVAGLGGASAAQVSALQDLLTYRVIETDVAKKSFLYGNIAGFRSATFNPDPRRSPALSNGAAIGVVADDGSTAYDVDVPTISTADLGTPSAGALRITGTGLAPYGMYEVTVVLLGTGARKLRQDQIVAGGGTVTDTQIDIPAALVPGVATTSTSARVFVNDMLSDAVALS